MYICVHLFVCVRLLVCVFTCVSFLVEVSLMIDKGCGSKGGEGWESISSSHVLGLNG